MKRQPLALLLVCAVAVTALLGSRTSWFGLRSASQSATAEWPSPNRDLASTRAAPGPSLSGAERALRVRWRFRLHGKVGFSGVFASTPVVSGDRVYIQDLNSNVFALSLADGGLLWTHRYDRPDGGPNGVTVADGMVRRQHRHDGVRPRRRRRERALARGG